MTSRLCLQKKLTASKCPKRYGQSRLGNHFLNRIYIPAATILNEFYFILFVVDVVGFGVTTTVHTITVVPFFSFIFLILLNSFPLLFPMCMLYVN